MHVTRHTCNANQSTVFCFRGSIIQYFLFPKQYIFLPKTLADWRERPSDCPKIKRLLFSLTVVSLTATAGADFQQLADTNVAFLAGETGHKRVPIDIVDDDILENNEQFVVFISSSNLGTTVSISRALVTIEDDDCKCIMSVRL